MDIQKDVPLKNYCTFAIGGEAEFFVTWKEHDEIEEILEYAMENNLKPFVFGGGTNLLFPDEGLNRLVIRAQTSDISQEGELLSVDAGCSWVKLHMYLKQANLYGLEAFSGLPGTIGGAAFGNAGAHGTEMKDVIAKLRVIDITTLEFQDIPVEDIEFGYRNSSLKNQDLVITKVWFKVSENPNDNTGDPDEFAEFRKTNQPQGLTTGSFFKNPTDNFAGKLIDEAGLKGHQMGGVMLSPKHANFFINTGDGTAKDVIALKDHVIEVVKSHSGIELKPEVQIIENI